MSDALHSHLTFGVQEGCPACAQVLEVLGAVPDGHAGVEEDQVRSLAFV